MLDALDGRFARHFLAGSFGHVMPAFRPFSVTPPQHEYAYRLESTPVRR